jgi:hypothetical protein
VPLKDALPNRVDRIGKVDACEDNEIDSDHPHRVECTHKLRTARRVAVGNRVRKLERTIRRLLTAIAIAGFVRQLDENDG